MNASQNMNCMSFTIGRAIYLPDRIDLYILWISEAGKSYESYLCIDVITSHIAFEGLSILRRNQDGQR